MNPESEHQSNAPDKTAKGPTSEENMYSVDPSRKRIRRGAIKRHIKKTRKPASKYNCDGSIIKEWRPPSQQTDREILSFYDWAKPQEFENIVRRDLVERLSTAPMIICMQYKKRMWQSESRDTVFNHPYEGGYRWLSGTVFTCLFLIAGELQSLQQILSPEE
ncbi:hypothetical protein N7489_004608 [Penicillium chrysogenum]|uniref:uncharacterized protein n=1 Tax=Penicillium chrysogenum TaxID=5076 RepID=UPI0024DF2687|nr:uncharacterized protein N7489_004608 [Penicillium chrysogenum]KAJ5244512.1 hypothetical protein N7489_004608 [Penicillium chrysogenum]KAJ5852973.1 hypothetical protein N7534_005516 [Penicillium rubens]